MLNNYLRVALQHLGRHRSYAFINGLGLSPEDREEDVSGVNGLSPSSLREAGSITITGSPFEASFRISGTVRYFRMKGEKLNHVACADCSNSLICLLNQLVS